MPEASSLKKEGTISYIETPGLLSPEELQRRKEKMLEEIDKSLADPDSRREKLRYVISEIAMHSVEDAIELWEKYADPDVDGDIIQNIFFVKETAGRHKRLFEDLSYRVKYLQTLNATTKRELAYFDFVLSAVISGGGAPLSWVTIHDTFYDPMQDYYAELLRKRAMRPSSEVPFVELADATKADRQAFGFLKQKYEAMEPHVPMTVLTGLLRKMTVGTLGEEEARILDPWKRLQSFLKLHQDITPYGERISTDLAERAIYAFAKEMEIPDDDLEKAKEEWIHIAQKQRYRPLDVIYEVKKQKVEKDLKDEIVDIMTKKGFSDPVVFQEEYGEFKIKVKKSEQQKNEKKEGVIGEPKVEEWDVPMGATVPQLLYKYPSGDPGRDIILMTDKNPFVYEYFAIKKGGGHFEGNYNESCVDQEKGIFYYISKNGRGLYELKLDQNYSPATLLKETTGKIFGLNMIGGELSYVVSEDTVMNYIYRGGKRVFNYIDTCSSGPGENSGKSFKVNGKSIFSAPCSQNKQRLYGENGDFHTEFDWTHDGVVDVQPFGQKGFVVAGYHDGKPVIHVSYDDGSTERFDLPREMGRIRKITRTSWSSICIVGEKGTTILEKDGESLSPYFDGALKDVVNSDDNLIQVVEEYANKTDIYISKASDSNKMPVLIKVIDRTKHHYESIQVIDKTPFIVLSTNDDSRKKRFFVGELNMNGNTASNMWNEVYDGVKWPYVFDEMPQIIKQGDRVVIAGFYRGKFITYEWKEGATNVLSSNEENKTEEGEERVLDWEEIYHLAEGVGDKKEDDKEYGSVLRGLRALELVHIEGPEIKEDIGSWISQPFLKPLKTRLKRAKEKLAGSSTTADTFTRALKRDPKYFLNTMIAVPDRTDRVYLDYLIDLAVPGAVNQALRGQSGLRGTIDKAFGYGEPVPSDFLSGSESLDLRGGDPEKGQDKEIFRVNDASGNIFVTGTYLGLKKSKGQENPFFKIPLSIDEKITGPSTEITGTIPLSSKNEGTIILPKRVGAQIIPDRVKVVFENGFESKLEVRKNEFGEDIVDLRWRKGMKSLVWSQEVTDLPYVPTDIHKRDYESLKEFSNEALTEDIVTLSAEDEYFIETLKDKTYKEKMYEIESYVKSISYYDFKNGEVMGDKMRLKPEERISFMKIRCKQLAKNNPALRDSNKKYAGVCTDFALLTTALQRKAGLISGVAVGAVARNGVATMKEAHAVSVVLWPEKKGKKLVVIDGTPSEGLTEEETKRLQEIAFDSLLEREKKRDGAEKEQHQKASKALAEIEERLKSGGENLLESLQNGELEHMLNLVLKYEVKKSHATAVSRLFEAARYAGLPVFSHELEDKIAVRKFFENEVTTKRSGDASEDGGTELFDTFRSYLDKYAADSGDDRGTAMKNIEHIIGLADPALNGTEKRVLRLLVQYLKAEKMKR